MKQPAPIWLAGALVVLLDAAILTSAAYNRGGWPTNDIELSERVLQLHRPLHDSTALFLRLEPGNGPAGGIDEAKLKEIGFPAELERDVNLAYDHARREGRRQAFVVWENREQQAGLPANAPLLLPVDAGLDVAALRRKYPDRPRYLIAPAAVELAVRLTDDSRQVKRIDGRVRHPLVRDLSVPPAAYGLLSSLYKTAPPPGVSRENGRPQPRFACRILYGRNYEPWVESCRLLVSPVR
jgi:hypothetical protein